MMLNTGLQTSIFAGSGYAPAATPAAAGASPQGPTTIGQKAFGVVTGGQSSSGCAHAALLCSGGFCLGALLFIYWSLPR